MLCDHFWLTENELVVDFIYKKIIIKLKLQNFLMLFDQEMFLLILFLNTPEIEDYGIFFLNKLLEKNISTSDHV